MPEEICLILRDNNMIAFKHKGDFKNIERFLNGVRKMNLRNILEKYANDGVTALSTSTPIDTGLTAASWKYEIKITNSGCNINWINTNEKNGVPIAILIQYGHGTNGGTYIQGYDFINPAIKPIFEKMTEFLWEEVINL